MMTRSVRVLDRDQTNPDESTVYFRQLDTDYVVELSYKEWNQFHKPDQITVGIVPGADVTAFDRV